MVLPSVARAFDAAAVCQPAEPDEEAPPAFVPSRRRKKKQNKPFRILSLTVTSGRSVSLKLDVPPMLKPLALLLTE